MQLSEVQKNVAEKIEGQILVVSCPGSGKTTTILQRVANMIDAGISEKELLILTFSKKAAAEMKERYVEQSKKKGYHPLPWFATIHAFCFSVISRAYNYQGKDVLGEQEARMIVRKGINYLKKQGILTAEIADKTEFTQNCLEEISVIKNNGVEWETYRARSCPTKDLKTIFDLYENKKMEIGKIDYDDMLQICYYLFLNYPDYLKWYQNCFRYLIIDEYQDTNYLQRDILYLLAGNPATANLCVVGDDDQSIYKFRGAKPEIMLGFQNDFPGCKTYYMGENYRSEPEIIEAAKRLIEKNSVRFQKEIKPVKHGSGQILSKEFPDIRKEIFFVVSELENLHKDTRYENMAVLYRNNSQAGYLSQVLTAKNIPFHSNDPIQSPYRHWIFEDLLSFYRLANDRGTGKDISRIINKPNRFLPADYLSDVFLDEKNVTDIICKRIPEDWKRNKARESIREFFWNLWTLKDLTPENMIQKIRDFCGYGLYLKNYASYRKKDPAELLGMLDIYLEDIRFHKMKSMLDLIDFADRFNRKIDQINSDKSKTGVALSTFHRSKGLEWDKVFILDANEGIIPSVYATSLDEIEEERRLMYVAVTRAKSYLYICWIKDSESEKSRFIKEMFGEITTPKKREQEKIKFKKNDRVVHQIYGTGRIVEIQKDKMIVIFDHSQYPRIFQSGEEQQLHHCII